MDNEKYQVYEMRMDDASNGAFAISLVEEPAIDEHFIKLAKEKPASKLVNVKLLNEEQRLLIGVLLRPNMRIFRRGVKGFNNNKPFYMMFKPHIVKRIAWDYIQNCKINNATLDHETPVDGITLVESWINNVDSTDGITNGFDINSKIGDWVGVIRVNNPKLWDTIKSNDYKGFSIEGLFNALPIPSNDIVVSELKLQAIKNIIDNINK